LKASSTSAWVTLASIKSASGRVRAGLVKDLPKSVLLKNYGCKDGKYKKAHKEGWLGEGLAKVCNVEL